MILCLLRFSISQNGTTENSPIKAVVELLKLYALQAILCSNYKGSIIETSIYLFCCLQAIGGSANRSDLRRCHSDYLRSKLPATRDNTHTADRSNRVQQCNTGTGCTNLTACTHTRHHHPRKPALVRTLNDAMNLIIDTHTQQAARQRLAGKRATA